MRKIIHRYTVLLLTVLLVGTGIALADTDVVVLGDVNSDGSVTTADVTVLVNYLHGSGTVDVVIADVNRDGAIDIADVTAIKNIISNGTFNKGTASTLFFPAATVNKSYGDATFTNQLVRSGSTGAITYESSAEGVATVNTTTGEVTIQGAGTATITATLAANGGISGTFASYTLYVAQATNSLTTTPVLASTSQDFTGSPVTLVTTEGAALFGSVEYSTTSATEGFSTTVPTATNAGDYTVWYRVPGTASYTAIDAVKLGTVTISPATLSVTASDYSGAYDGEAHGITVTCEGATIKYRTTAEGDYNLSENPTFTDVTDAQTVYYQVTKENYTTVEGSKTVTITQKALTITAKAQSIAYGNSIATGTGQVTADGLVDGDALTSVTLTPSTNQVTTSGTITPSAATATKGIGNYSVTYTAGTLTITAVAATVTTPPTGKTELVYSGAALELVDAGSAACTGGTLVYCKTENGEYGAASTITETAAGTYSFYYKVQGDGNHSDSSPVQVTGVTIAKATIANDSWSVSPGSLSITDSSSGTITVSFGGGSSDYGTVTVSGQGTVCTTSVAGGTITVTGASAGSATLTVTVGDGENYTFEGSHTCSLTVTASNPLASVTTDHLGYYVCTDGSYYSPSTAVPSGKTVAGMIAYVSSTGHGLILAKSDANSGTAAYWSTINSACSSYSPKITAGGTALTWHLPSRTEWINMGATAGSWSALSSRLSALSSRGISTVQSYYYWSSANGSKYYYLYDFNDSGWGSYYPDYDCYGRACAAF